MAMDVIHFSIRPINACLTTAAAPLLGMIGYIRGSTRFGGVEVLAPHPKADIAHFDALGADAGDLVHLVEKLNVAEMKKDGLGYQMRGGRRQRNPDTNEIMPIERSHGPVLARHIDVALPFGVPAETRIAIAREFAEFLHEHFGTVVIFAVHNKLNLPANDGHYIIPERKVGADGKVGAKIRELNGIASTARPAKLSTELAETAPTSTCETLRATYAAICNRHLDAVGAAKIAHESYARRGIVKTPQMKRNRAAEMRTARIGGREVASAPLVVPTGFDLRRMRKRRMERRTAIEQSMHASVGADLSALNAEIGGRQTLVSGRELSSTIINLEPQQLPREIDKDGARNSAPNRTADASALTAVGERGEQAQSDVGARPTVDDAKTSDDADPAFVERVEEYYAKQAVSILAKPINAKIRDAKTLAGHLEHFPGDGSPARRERIVDWLAANWRDLRQRALAERDRADKNLLGFLRGTAASTRETGVTCAPAAASAPARASALGSKPSEAPAMVAVMTSLNPPSQPTAQAGGSATPKSSSPATAAITNREAVCIQSSRPPASPEARAPGLAAAQPRLTEQKQAARPPIAATGAPSLKPAAASGSHEIERAGARNLAQREADKQPASAAVQSVAPSSASKTQATDAQQDRQERADRADRPDAPGSNPVRSKENRTGDGLDLERAASVLAPAPTEPAIIAFHPGQLSATEQRLFGVLIRLKKSPNLVNQIRLALTNVIKKLEAWWASATKGQKDEIRSWPKPSREQIVADLLACGVKQPTIASRGSDIDIK